MHDQLLRSEIEHRLQLLAEVGINMSLLTELYLILCVASYKDPTPAEPFFNISSFDRIRARWSPRSRRSRTFPLVLTRLNLRPHLTLRQPR